MKKPVSNKRPYRKSLTRWIRRMAPATLIGIVTLVLLCSVLYDFALKLGLSSVSRFFLDIITLGSDRLRDAAYAYAALDPTPVTPLILVMVLSSLVMLPLLNMLVSPLLKPKFRQQMD